MRARVVERRADRARETTERLRAERLPRRGSRRAAAASPSRAPTSRRGPRRARGRERSYVKRASWMHTPKSASPRASAGRISENTDLLDAARARVEEAVEEVRGRARARGRGRASRDRAPPRRRAARSTGPTPNPSADPDGQDDCARPRGRAPRRSCTSPRRARRARSGGSATRRRRARSRDRGPRVATACSRSPWNANVSFGQGEIPIAERSRHESLAIASARAAARRFADPPAPVIRGRRPRSRYRERP